ncbi:MAG: GNAT family N-acetyltransferase [Solirubrobacterales bacterium]
MTAVDRSVVREAEGEDLATLTQTMVHAFADDPFARWVAPRKSDRMRVLRGYFDVSLTHKQSYGFVHCTGDHLGAAIWVPPDESELTVREAWAIIRPNVVSRLAFRAPLLARGLMQIDRLHPEQPHFYLAAIGVEPSAQGRGLGSQLLAPVLELCDADRIGAYLESSNPANVDMYARHGFRVVKELKLPRGPVIHTMWRDPGTG